MNQAKNYWKRNMEARDQGNYDLLISVLKEIDLTEQEVNTLAWLSTCEKSSIKNICSIIEKIKGSNGGIMKKALTQEDVADMNFDEV